MKVMGIKDIDKNKIFEKFYTVNHSVVDSKKVTD